MFAQACPLSHYMHANVMSRPWSGYGPCLCMVQSELHAWSHRQGLHVVQYSLHKQRDICYL